VTAGAHGVGDVAFVEEIPRDGIAIAGNGMGTFIEEAGLTQEFMGRTARHTGQKLPVRVAPEVLNSAGDQHIAGRQRRHDVVGVKGQVVLPAGIFAELLTEPEGRVWL